MYEETERLRQSTNEQYVDAWTGLYKKPVSDKNEWNWRWSQAGMEYTENATNWCNGEPNDKGDDEYCVVMTQTKCLMDVSCMSQLHPLICYNGKNKLQ